MYHCLSTENEDLIAGYQDFVTSPQVFLTLFIWKISDREETVKAIMEPITQFRKKTNSQRFLETLWLHMFMNTNKVHLPVQETRNRTNFSYTTQASFFVEVFSSTKNTLSFHDVTCFLKIRRFDWFDTRPSPRFRKILTWNFSLVQFAPLEMWTRLK